MFLTCFFRCLLGMFLLYIERDIVVFCGLPIYQLNALVLYVFTRFVYVFTGF